MPRARANGIEIEYDERGPRGGRPLLLVMGLGAQLIFWDDELCDALVARGHRVIRFDNRDVGLSTKFEALGTPAIPEVLAGTARTPYRLSDMADDAAGLLDALGLDSAHLVGASMGGMIAQAFALEHRSRARSLTSIMSSTGNPDLPPARPEAMAQLMLPPPQSRAEVIERSVRSAHIMTGKGFTVDEERARDRAARAYDRCFHPAGMARQMAAVMGSESRRAELASLRLPTLVIHGDDDPLVPVEAGYDTAEAIPGARLLVIEGMGHALPLAAHPRIVDAISQHTTRAEA
jgi:pimeloyl-ACP methyl ester carboxylesterase